MLHTVFFIELLLVSYTTQSPMKIEAKCNEDVSLPCEGEGKNISELDFYSVTWYKTTPVRVGIIRKGKDGKVDHFPSNVTARIGEKFNLLLDSVAAINSGTYECDVSANIGSQNMNFAVDLFVHDTECMSELTTAKTVQNTTNASICSTRVEELPVMWSAICFVAVSIVKITLCVISIWVVRISSSKQQHRRW